MGVEEAIMVAIAYVKKLFEGTDYRLEEVEFGEGRDGDESFVITVSFRPPAGSPNAVTALGNESMTNQMFGGRRAAIGIDATRFYKDVVVGLDGRVRAVRMRQIVVG